MADVTLDPDTRAPSPAWQKIARFVGAFLAMKLALWVAPLGLTLTAEDQLWVAAGFAMLAGAVGTEARDRGWPVLRLLFVLPLALTLASCGGKAPVSPAKAFAAAAGTYETLAAGMAIYCEQPTAHAESCIRAAKATLTAEAILSRTRTAVADGSASDAELEAAAAALEATMPELRRVQP